MCITDQSHSIDNWHVFTEEGMLKMDGKKALKFWSKYKSSILNIVELSNNNK